MLQRCSDPLTAATDCVNTADAKAKFANKEMNKLSILRLNRSAVSGARPSDFVLIVRARQALRNGDGESTSCWCNEVKTDDVNYDL